MNDVGALRDGDWHWNGWLTAKGRVIALFALLRIDAETLWILLPDTSPATFADALRRYVFRSKVTISVRDDLRIAGRHAASALASGNHAIEIDGAFELDLSGQLGATHAGRSLRIGMALDAVDDAAAVQAWRAADLAHGWPRLEASQCEQWTPQQLSLERLHAFSVKKGCYPGQEIVARTHFLGQAKRGLARIRSVRPFETGATLVDDAQRELGHVVSTAGDTALAVVGAGTTGQGADWRFEPLEDGLAR